MKKLLLLLVLLSSQVVGQDNEDWILPKEGDTIHCDITKATSQSLYYKISDGGTTILSMSKVKTYSGGAKSDGKPIIADCDYSINEVDKFTKTKKLYTKPVPLVYKLGGYVYASGVVLDKFKILRLAVSSHGIMSIDKDSELMLMGASDSVIKLSCIEYVVSTSVTVGSATSWKITARYDISQDQLEYLINNKITDGRYYTTKGYVDFVIKEKHVAPFQHMLRCIQ